MFTKLLLLLTLFFYIHMSEAYCQVSELDNNSGIATDFLGWDAAVVFDLDIIHKANSAASDINFFTRNIMRMTLNDQGLLGLGLNTHSSLLHLGRNAASLGDLFRTDGLSNEVTNWQLYTGINLIPNNQIERFRLYAEANTTPWIGLQSLSNGMRFETAGGNQRIRINGSSNATINGFAGVNTTGFVGITPTASPWAAAGPHSALHLMEEPANGPLALGYRTWMRIGVTYSTNSDFMYTGLRALGNDITEGVFAFGDNSDYGGGIGPDQLVVRFVNGSGLDASGAGSADGLEIMRFSGMDGGRVAIGDEFHYTPINRQPQRRLHVHDPGTSNITDAQLRISETLSDVDPVAVDFRSTAEGNLYINCYGEEQRVGIEEPLPLERLDVAGNGRFQDIPNTAANCVIFGEMVTAGQPQDNRLKRLDFNNDPNSYLGGDGTWQTIGGGGVCDWNIVNGGLDLAMGYGAGACVPGNVGIGVQPAVNARLDVYYDATESGIPEHGIHTDMIGGSYFNYGNRVDLESFGPPYAEENYGFYSYTKGANKNYGGNFNGYATSNTIANFGVYANGDGGAFSNANYGVYAKALGGGAAYGLYATASAGLTNWSGYFNGDVKITGFLDVAGTVYTSDESLKTNIQPIDSSLSKILLLDAISYNWNQDNDLNIVLPEATSFGFSAQQVQNIFPEIVQQMNHSIVDDEGNPTGETASHLGVRYVELIPILVKGMQEQQARIDELEIQLNSCCTVANDTRSFEVDGNVKEKDVTLNNKSIILNQNVPNPFAEQTTINYNINDDFSKAQILFYDAGGKLIQATDITTKGAGQLNVFADDLTSGVYSYALVVDGKIMDTKKMVKQ